MNYRAAKCLMMARVASRHVQSRWDRAVQPRMPFRVGLRGVGSQAEPRSTVIDDCDHRILLLGGPSPPLFGPQPINSIIRSNFRSPAAALFDLHSSPLFATFSRFSSPPPPPPLLAPPFQSARACVVIRHTVPDLAPLGANHVCSHIPLDYPLPEA